MGVVRRDLSGSSKEEPAKVHALPPLSNTTGRGRPATRHDLAGRLSRTTPGRTRPARSRRRQSCLLSSGTPGKRPAAVHRRRRQRTSHDSASAAKGHQRRERAAAQARSCAVRLIVCDVVRLWNSDRAAVWPGLSRAKRRSIPVQRFTGASAARDHHGADRLARRSDASGLQSRAGDFGDTTWELS